MSYTDFWDGDPEMTKYYRDKYKRDRDRRNTELWLQGLYVYEAILDSAPVLNPLSKDKKPIPYRETPIPLTEQERAQREEEENKKKMEQGIKAMMQLTNTFNKRFENGRA